MNRDTHGSNLDLRGATLVVVDMQLAFQAESSAWAVPRYDEISGAIESLVGSFGDRVAWTKFVRDAAEVGSWAAYYDRWSSFRISPDSEQWNLTFHPRPDHLVFSKHTFSKWGPELESVVPAGGTLVVCGVATDCCILTTVLAAIDAGRSVVVAVDACAAVSDKAQEHALQLLELFSPLVTFMDTPTVLDRLNGDGKSQ